MWGGPDGWEGTDMAVVAGRDLGGVRGLVLLAREHLKGCIFFRKPNKLRSNTVDKFWGRATSVDKS